MNHESNANLPSIIGAADTQLIRWVESGECLGSLGHGVQFLHGAVRRKRVVAFLEGFEWFEWLHRPGSRATVRILSIRPRSIAANRWAEIIRSVREAVPVFLSDEDNLACSFRHGPIHILING
jgi:hypothetical protein